MKYQKLIALALTLLMAALCAVPACAAEAESAALELGGGAGIDGVSYADGVYTVESAGTYRLTGLLTGRLVVDADGPVELILAGAGLYGPECLRVISKYPVAVTAAASTRNVLSDGQDGSDSDTLVSKAPLTLGGTGILTVLAGGCGVYAKQGVTVTGGEINILAGGSGVKAKGALTVTGGSLTVDAGKDALASEAGRLEEGGVFVAGGSISLTAQARGIDAEGAVDIAGGVIGIAAENDGVRGDSFIMDGGALTVDAGCDGIQAETALSVLGGSIGITAGGGGGNAIDHAGESFGPWGSSAEEETASAKGLKCEGEIRIADGEVILNTLDDSVHCGTVFTMDGGSLWICAGDDAIHADDVLYINGGTVDITDCFEGLEAFAVEIGGGDIVIRAVNDGINANGAEMMFRRSTTEETEATSASGSTVSYVWMKGGRVDLVVTGNAQNQGDGVDSNGSFFISGGELIVSTFGTFMENGLDTGYGGPVAYGGMAMAGGSSTMMEGWSSSSTQCCASISTGTQPGGTVVTITDEDGNEIWSVTMEDTFSALQMTHPDMQVGHVYTVSYGTGSTTLDFTTGNVVKLSSFGFGGGPGRW